MADRQGIFAPLKHPVMSLEVQASLGEVETPQRTQFQLLVRHFLDRFFNNEMLSSDGQTRARVLQVVYALSLPGLCVAIYLFPAYHAPHGRGLWSQVADHYFYTMYSFVATGVTTIFAWDLFFPDLLDVFVLSTLSIERRTLFFSRIAAVGTFLGIFLLGINALGGIFFPAAADLPSLTRHLCAHLLAVTGIGVFIAAFFVALQGMMLIVLGERLFRRISPFVQGLSITLLLTILLLFPVLSRFLEPLLLSRASSVRYFPPFWFLGIYEWLLRGPSAEPIFFRLSVIGLLAIVAMLALVILSYPLAYRRRMRQVVEGSVTSSRESIGTIPFQHVLHATLLRTPQSRGIYHFISQTLLRTQRHRVYLAMYGGLGLALILASGLMLQLDSRRVALVFSSDGLRAAVPIVACWTIAGLRAAFLAPVDRRTGWLFRVIHGKPGLDEFAATRRWVLFWALLLTLGTVVTVHAIAPPELRGLRVTAIQIVVAAGLSLLLTDAFFLNVKTIPFTGVPPSSSTNLAYVLIQYFGLFPPFVLLVVGMESWLEADKWHLLVACGALVLCHLELQRRHRILVAYDINLIDQDEDQDEFPQRLGLRY